MKKLIFIGVTLLGIGVCADELWGKDIPVKSFSNLRSKSMQSKNSRSNKKSTSSKSVSTEQRKKSNVRNSIRKSSDELKGSSRSTSKKNTAKNAPVKNKTVSKDSDASFSKLKLEDNASYILKNIIGSIPSTDIRVLISNMDILSRSLPKKNGAKDVKTVVKKMDEASTCFDELLRVRSNLNLELFNQREERSSLPDSVELDRIVESLDRVDTKKLGEIITTCVQKKLSTRVINNLKGFSRKIKETRKILEEMRKEFSPVVLSRIEGLPELKNLEATDTAANRRLAKSREKLDANRTFEDNSDENDLNEENASFEAEPEGKLDENSSNVNVPQKKNEQKPDQGKDDGISGGSGKNSDNEELKLKKKKIIDIWKSKSPEKNTNTESAASGESLNETSSKIPDDGEGKNKPSLSAGSAEKEDSGEKASKENSISEQSETQNAQQKPNENVEPTKIAENSNEQPSPEKSNQVNQEEDDKNSDSQSSSEEQNQESQQEDGENSNSQSSSEKPNQESQQEDDENSNSQSSSKKPNQINQQEGDKNSDSQPSSEKPNQNGNEERQNYGDTSATTVVDLNDIESLEKFYKHLETNIGLLYERDFTNKQKTVCKKIKGYLKEIKSERSFEQKVSDVDRIIKAYNSLVALKPKTKDRENLPSVRRDKIKSLQGKIYMEVFDDLSSRVKRLQSNEKLGKLNMEKDFKKLLADNEKNKEKFKRSNSGREKRQIMIDSAESYDRMMEKIWKYPELIKTKRDREEFDRIGYTLDPVILSIDVNPGR